MNEPSEFITIQHGMRGYFAVHIRITNGLPEPWQSGDSSHKTAAGAEPEARSWADAEGIPYIKPRELQPMPSNTAFGISDEDVAIVLRANSLKATNANGMSFEAMAEMLLPQLDHDKIEAAALHYDSLDDQTQSAHEEIHRQLHTLGYISVPPKAIVVQDGIIQAARTSLIEALAKRASSQDPREVLDDYKTGFPGFNNMTIQELDNQARQYGITHQVAGDLAILGLAAPRYMHGDWMHLFGPGKTETHTRLCYDLVEECMVAVQIKDGAGSDDFIDASRGQLTDVEDSLKNGNLEAIACPEDFGLQLSVDLPAWAEETEQEQPNVLRPRG